MSTSKPRTPPSFPEFVGLMALVISLVALSIDAMLPALPEIASDLGAASANDGQFVITILFLGMAVGQIFFGPLSDVIGRKPAINIGFGIFFIGCLVSLWSSDFSHMLMGRFLQGLGAAGPRIVSVALIRDCYKGRTMARVMSFVMTIFILVPVVAPALGQLILAVADWRAIFLMFLILTIVSFLWFSIRQPETLHKQDRKPLSFENLLIDVKTVCSMPVAMGYTIAMGFLFGSFVGYLSSAQSIFQIQYRLDNLFPLYFGCLAAAIGVASLINAKLVMHFGMRRLSGIAMLMISFFSLPFLVYVYGIQGHPPLPMLMAYLLLVFFFMGILFGNLNAMAMEPLGHIAGMGSAVVGSISTFMSVLFGAVIANAYDDTVIPLVAGFAGLSLLCLLTMYLTEKFTNRRIAGSECRL